MEKNSTSKNVQKEDSHRSSIASTASLEHFAIEEPQKTSKRVSFTDEQITTSKSDDKKENEDLSNKYSEKENFKEQEKRFSTFANPLSFCLLEAQRYLEQLHHPAENKDLVVNQTHENNPYSPFYDNDFSHQNSSDDSAKLFGFGSKTVVSHSIKSSQLPGRSVKKTPQSAMECEVKYDKLRWLLISECSAFLGSGKHTRESFHKKFLHKVSIILELNELNFLQFFN